MVKGGVEMMLLGWIAIGAVIYLLFKDSISNKFKIGSSSKESSLKQLDARFINGEIDEETYLRMKSLINQK